MDFPACTAQTQGSGLTCQDCWGTHQSDQGHTELEVIQQGTPLQSHICLVLVVGCQPDVADSVVFQAETIKVNAQHHQQNLSTEQVIPHAHVCLLALVHKAAQTQASSLLGFELPCD